MFLHLALFWLFLSFIRLFLFLRLSFRPKLLLGWLIQMFSIEACLQVIALILSSIELGF